MIERDLYLSELAYLDELFVIESLEWYFYDEDVKNEAYLDFIDQYRHRMEPHIRKVSPYMKQT